MYLLIFFPWNMQDGHVQILIPTSYECCWFHKKDIVFCINYTLSGMDKEGWKENLHMKADGNYD